MISYRIGTSGQHLLLTDVVLSHFDRHRQRAHHSREAGGQLFATFDANLIQIALATGPRDSDRRGFRYFIPNRWAERREIRQLFKAGLHFVGDWHTHPEPRPRPSITDIESCQDMFRKSRHKLGGFLIVIVGMAEPPEGIFVGIVSDESVNRLTPSPTAPLREDRNEERRHLNV